MLDLGVFRASFAAYRILVEVTTMVTSPSTQLDEMFACLANRYRRQVLLEVLEDIPEPVSQITRVAANRGDRGLQRLQIELYHVHLPKLDSAGYVRWNRDTLGVERGPRFHEIEPVLRSLTGGADELPNGWL